MLINNLVKSLRILKHGIVCSFGIMHNIKELPDGFEFPYYSNPSNVSLDSLDDINKKINNAVYSVLKDNIDTYLASVKLSTVIVQLNNSYLISKIF